MLKGELTIEQAKALVSKGHIVYPVVNSQFDIVKIFDYHREAFQYATANRLQSHNITHPRCPRSVKFQLGRLEQLDLFLDLEPRG